MLLINDDYTTMEFVVSVLEGVFQKSPAEAFRLMMRVHTEGQAACGTYTYEVAETKVATVRDLAASRGFPCRPPSKRTPDGPRPDERTACSVLLLN